MPRWLKQLATAPLAKAQCRPSGLKTSPVGHGRRFGTMHAGFSIASVSRPSASSTDKPLECHFRTLSTLAEPITPVPRRRDQRRRSPRRASAEWMSDTFHSIPWPNIIPTCPQSRGRLPRHRSRLSEFTRFYVSARLMLSIMRLPLSRRSTLRRSESAMSCCGARRGNRVRALPWLTAPCSSAVRPS
jgi:hypothetical protein